MTKTIILTIPDWQAGNREEYFFGAKLINWLIPRKDNQKEIEVDVEAPSNKGLEKENGVFGQSIVKQNVKAAKKMIAQENPEKIITLGGNCLVSQAPFDYLKGKYGNDLGVIWIDTHPDISTPEDFTNEHAMVVNNLLGKGDKEVSQLVENPFNPKSFLFVGLQELHNYEENNLDFLGFNYRVQNNDDILSPEEIKTWIKENNFSKTAIHLDLDVLNPNEFRDNYFAEPGVSDFPAAAGNMTLNQLAEILKIVSDSSEIVGLTIAEYLPWDAINLKNTLSELDILK